MEVLFVALLLIVGALARPNGPPLGGGNFGQNGGGPTSPFRPNGAGNFPPGPNQGGNFPFRPNGAGNFPRGPNGGGNFPFRPNGAGNFPPGPNGGGNFPFWPNGAGNFPSGQAPAQLNSWYPYSQEDDLEDQEPFGGQDPNGFAPVDLRGGHRGPHGGRRPPFPPGWPVHPPVTPVQPNVTFTPLFRIDNVTAQNISASVPLKQGENVFILPPSIRPLQFGPPVVGPQPYFKIIYNQNSTKIAFEFGTAQFVPPFFGFGSDSHENRPHPAG